MYVGLNPSSYLSGLTSGQSVTANSGGVFSSGGFSDGIEMAAGDALFVPRSRLSSGILSILLNVPAAASGGVMYWDYFVWAVVCLLPFAVLGGGSV